MIFHNAVEVGNKVIANFGKMNLYGKPRDSKTRLATSAARGDTKILVEKNLDWKTGEQIVLAPTGFDHLGSDYVTIK